MLESDLSAYIQLVIKKHYEQQGSVRISGLGSKDFLGFPDKNNSTSLQLANHQGIIDYQPAELVITLRGSTSIAELNTTLSQFNQHIAGEVPMINSGGSIGGAIAAGWSGPAGPFRGQIRDAILGMKIINGKGQILNFGGKVIKNVAGFDVPRLLCGSYGTLGIITEVSLKTTPLPACQYTLIQELNQNDAIIRMNEIAARTASLSGACWRRGQMYLRFDDLHADDKKLLKQVGGELMSEKKAKLFWASLRDWQRHLFTDSLREVWRLHCKPTLPDLQLPGETIIDHCGSLRWYMPNALLDQRFFLSELHAHNVRGNLIKTGTSGRWFFLDIPEPLQMLHKKLKKAFDPGNVLNPGIIGF